MADGQAIAKLRWTLPPVAFQLEWAGRYRGAPS